VIENLWRHIKYRWLDGDACQNLQTLCQNIMDILAQVGTKYRLSFA